MFSSFPALFSEAWLQPRQSMRRILDLRLREQDRIVMVAVIFVLFGVLLGLMLKSAIPIEGMEEPTPSISVLMLSVGAVIMGLIAYYIQAFLIRVIGGAFGGTATAEDSRSVAAWSQLITGTANLAIMIVGLALPIAISTPLGYLVSLATIIVTASYIAEAHNFQSTIKVIGVVLGLSLALMLLLQSMIPAQMMVGA